MEYNNLLLVGGIAFIVLLLFGGLSSCSLFGGNSGSGLIASSYLCLLYTSRLDEIVDLMLETVCTARKTIRIAGDDYPAELVKSKFMKPRHRFRGAVSMHNLHVLRANCFWGLLR